LFLNVRVEFSLFSHFFFYLGGFFPKTFFAQINVSSFLAPSMEKFHPEKALILSFKKNNQKLVCNPKLHTSNQKWKKNDFFFVRPKFWCKWFKKWCLTKSLIYLNEITRMVLNNGNDSQS
jgi:hypothetical protein